MNIKEIKDAARQAFRDQQTQDTEVGVPDSVSFIAGFQAGAKHIQEILDRADRSTSRSVKVYYKSC